MKPVSGAGNRTPLAADFSKWKRGMLTDTPHRMFDAEESANNCYIHGLFSTHATTDFLHNFLPIMTTPCWMHTDKI